MVGNQSIRLILAYGAQENELKEKKDKFLIFIEEKVVVAENEGQGLIIQLDGNLHAGPALLKDDPNPQNRIS